MMWHVVTALGTAATLLYHLGCHIGHKTVYYEIKHAVEHVGVIGLRAVRPMVSAVRCCSCRTVTTAVLLLLR